MRIFCKNCNFEKEVEKLEYQDDKCPICENMLYVSKEDLINYIIDDTIAIHLKHCIQRFGIEGTLELLERLKNYPVSKLYVKKLETLLKKEV